jgi:hypothetical protein
MGHVICSVKTCPNQCIVKLNLFNYFAFCYSSSSSLLFSKSESESSTKLTLIGDVMDAKVSHKPCPCPSFNILYILLRLKPVQHLGRVLFQIRIYRKNIRHCFYNFVL